MNDFEKRIRVTLENLRKKPEKDASILGYAKYEKETEINKKFLGSEGVLGYKKYKKETKVDGKGFEHE